MTLICVTLVLVTVTSLSSANNIVWTHHDDVPESSGSGQVLSREAHVENFGDFRQKYPKQNVQHQQLPQHSSAQSQHQLPYASTFGHVTVGPPHAYHYAIYPHYPGSGTYQNYDYPGTGGGSSVYSSAQEESSWLCSMLAGLCDDDGTHRQDGPEDPLAIGGGIAGGVAGIVAIILAVLKALKLSPLLKLLLPLKPFKIFLPLLLPFLPILIVPLLLLVALPILLPVVVVIGIPLFIASWFLPIVPVLVNARRLSMIGARSLHETLFSEQCLERVSCEVFKLSKAYEYEAPWVQKFLENPTSYPKWIDRVAKAGKSAAKSGGCEAYTCNPVGAFRKYLKNN